MDLRDYQIRAVRSVFKYWADWRRLLGVAATGAGKTVIAAHILKERMESGPCLFVAHREELLAQAIDKLWRVTGEDIGLEQADSHSHLGHRIVVASVASLHQARIAKWPSHYFQTIIIDECHRAAAKSYQNVLNHFDEAKVLGITATPDRNDQKSLGSIFESIAFEIGLIELIEKKWLAPIRVEQIPLKIDLSGVGLDSRGDLDVTQTAHVLEPYLDSLAEEILAHRDRKTLVFLPLVRLSQDFAESARALGLAAEHIDGNSPDRKQILERFKRNQTRVLSCAALLSEGYDEPSVDCIVMMRPTQSRTLYCQCLGRGFRTCEGKKDLLVLDPLWLSGEHSLVRPANLVAATEDEAEQIFKLLGEEPDLLRAKAKAKEINLALVRERAKRLAERLDATSKRQRQLFDPLEAASVLADPELAEYEPVMGWQEESVSVKQAGLLTQFGVDPKAVKCKGQASAILSRLIKRRKQSLATFRQLRCLVQYGYPDPQHATFEDASKFLDRKFGGGKRRLIQGTF
jgi:superfamily II DNA or RNA helicase